MAPNDRQRYGCVCKHVAAACDYQHGLLVVAAIARLQLLLYVPAGAAGGYGYTGGGELHAVVGG